VSAGRVLVLRALGLGDLLTAVPALRALRAAFPSATITLATPAAVAPLALLTGAVDRVADTGPLASLDPALAGADVAVNLHGRGPQSTRILAATRPRRLIAFGAGPAAPAWRSAEHEVRRWCRLLTESGIPADPSDLDLALPPVPSPAPGAVVLHPGAASESRRWPVDRWAEVGRAVAATDRRVVVTGSTAEIELGAEVGLRAGLPPESLLAGRTGLLELAALVARASTVVSGDTGVAHLATAYRTPSVLLFGPTPPARWGPPADRPRHTVLWAGLAGDPHGNTPDAGLLQISVAEVLAALRRGEANGR
jgi:ADP-heptose:LPS heptosyltransferase